MGFEIKLMTTLFLQNQYEGLQWGRPGPGGVYWRESAVTGQKFFDKMVNAKS